MSEGMPDTSAFGATPHRIVYLALRELHSRKKQEMPTPENVDAMKTGVWKRPPRYIICFNFMSAWVGDSNQIKANICR